MYTFFKYKTCPIFFSLFSSKGNTAIGKFTTVFMTGLIRKPGRNSKVQFKNSKKCLFTYFKDLFANFTVCFNNLGKLNLLMMVLFQARVNFPTMRAAFKNKSVKLTLCLQNIFFNNFKVSIYRTLYNKQLFLAQMTHLR